MPTLELETAVSHQHHYRHIAGLDEAGRGALAGPVVAAAVILPLHDPLLQQSLDQVNDSKLLTPSRRESLFERIRQHAVACGVGSTPPQVIDEIGIVPATKLAMQAALQQLDPAAEYLLVDGRLRLSAIPTPQQSVIRGDSLSLSIAAASILAKVTRDRLMVAAGAAFPAYGFAQHKGYGTAQHLAALAKHGPCAIHRHSFAPIRQPFL